MSEDRLLSNSPSGRSGRFDLRVWAARKWERSLIEAAEGELGSDACVIVTYGDLLLGWSDDYGTFHPMTHEGRRQTERVEALLAAVIELAASA